MTNALLMLFITSYFAKVYLFIFCLKIIESKSFLVTIVR